MKKISMTMAAFFTVLFSCLFLMGCPNDIDTGTPAQGNLLILQAYGNAGDGSPAGVSHSFVELYNISDEEIKLDGIGLYYANGKGSLDAAEDEPWERISLDGKTIFAGESFLILGAQHSDLSGTCYKISDGYGDINDNNLSLSRRGFKVALIKSTEELTAQNPFKPNGSGEPVSGYIDMVGAANEYQEKDLIYGFEIAPARNSASEAVRRKDLIDTDDNSKDFESARYAADGMSVEELELRKPRNSSEGAWNPITGEYDGLPQTTAGNASAHAGKLLILQIGASADDDNNISHSFVELYNAGDSDINLSGFTLQYAAGTKVANNATKDGKWQKIDLTGTIEKGRSFLILGAERSSSANPALNIAANSGDMNIDTFKLDNRAVKVALIKGADLLTVQNPFNMDGNGGKAAGYVDMIGVINDSTDQIFGWEGSSADAPAGTAPFRITKQVGVRRTSLTDTDVNKDDFATVTYASLSAEAKEIMRPKNLSKGEWDPLEEPAVGEGTPKLMILQANTYGNNNGGAAGFSKSLVELYNNTDNDINLSNYYLHIGNRSRPSNSDPWTIEWTHIITLTGTIPAKKSFLVVSNTDAAMATPRAILPAADQEAAFTLSNDGFKVAIMRNQSGFLSVANPFGEASLSGDYVDMLGVTNNIDGFETAAASQSRPQGPRRTSLTDTDDNSTDFAQADYRGGRLDDYELYKFWPRNSAAGLWNPITGIPAFHPIVQLGE